MLNKIHKLKVLEYPRVKEQDFEKWNEAMFKKYDNERVYNHTNLIIRFVERQRVNAVLSLLGKTTRNDTILAAGCGEGYIEEKIKSSKIIMVDLSSEALKRARKRFKNKKTKIKFLKANLEKLPLSKNTVSKIECSEVIEHVYNPRKMLSEFHRISKENAILVISFPNEPLINFLKKILISLHLFYHFFPNIPKDMTEEWHLRSMTLKKFEGYSKKLWRLDVVSGAPFNFFPLRYIVKCTKL